MTTQPENTDDQRAAAAAGAAGNHGLGVDGDDPSAADQKADAVQTGGDATDHPTGEAQAQENTERESPA